MNTFIFAEPEEKKEIISILNQKGLMGNIYCGNTFEDVKGIIDKAPGENRFIASDRKAKNILGQIGLMKSNLFLWTKGTLVRYGDYKTVKLKQKEAVSVGAWQEAKAWNELEYSMDYLNTCWLWANDVELYTCTMALLHPRRLSNVFLMICSRACVRTWIETSSGISSSSISVRKNSYSV